MSGIPVANAPCSWGVLEFAGTELGDWGFMPTDPRELARELGSRKLGLRGAGGRQRHGFRQDAERRSHRAGTGAGPSLLEGGGPRREGWDYFTSVRGGVFCELGQGAVAFAAIVKELRTYLSTLGL